MNGNDFTIAQMHVMLYVMIWMLYVTCFHSIRSSWDIALMSSHPPGGCNVDRYWNMYTRTVY